METVQISFPIKDQTPYTEEKAVASMMKGLNDLIKYGALKGKVDDFLQNYEMHEPGGYAVATISKDAIVDASKLNTEGAFMSYPVDLATDEIAVGDRQFSAATIQERLRMSKMAPKMKFRLTVLDYQKFYKANQRKMRNDTNLAKNLKNMFLVDLMGIFTQILPLIQEGKQLAQLTGLTTIAPGLNQISRELSVAYRKALNQAKNGQISGSTMKLLQQKYSQFINALIPEVFPGIHEILSDTRVHSDGSEAMITIGCLDSETASKVAGYIKQFSECDLSNKIQVTEVENRNYSYNETGRINLF
jgi:hypothetical protein